MKFRRRLCRSGTRTSRKVEHRARCFFFSSRRRHTRCLSDWSSDVCSSDLNISQNLLQGFGASVNNRYIRIARNNSRYSELQLKQQVTTTVSAVLNLYWDLVAFNEDARLKRLALDAARQLYEDNKKELAAGAIAAIEVT